jgi:hypothetical protein
MEEAVLFHEFYLCTARDLTGKNKTAGAVPVARWFILNKPLSQHQKNCTM